MPFYHPFVALYSILKPQSEISSIMISYSTRKPIIYVDMDDTIVEYTKAKELAIEKDPGISFPQSQLDFFRNLEPIRGAIEAIGQLEGLGYDVYILTAPSLENPLCYMEKRIWVENHLGVGWIRKLIISPNKGLLKGQYLIDDWTEGRGQENFEGELIHYGSTNFPDWTAVSKHFVSKKK